MGWTFGNLHIQKKPEVRVDQVIQKITAYYAQFGYGVCKETEAELSLAVLDGDDSAWISVYSDFFEDPQDREALARWLSQSEKLRVLDIGCFDSNDTHCSWFSFAYMIVPRSAGVQCAIIRFAVLTIGYILCGLLICAKL